MTLENKDYSGRLRAGWLAFMILAGWLVVFGLFLVPNAFAINQTAIDQYQDDFANYTTYQNAFSVFWVIFILIMLCLFMICMMRMREDRETVFFSLGALILSILLTLLFTSPLDFDIQETQKTVVIVSETYETALEEPTGSGLDYITENGTSVTVTTNQNQTVIIPADSEFRFAFVALFTGLTLFNGLYSIYILTNFHLKGFNETFRR